MMDISIILASSDRSEGLLMPGNARELKAMKTNSDAEDWVKL